MKRHHLLSSDSRGKEAQAAGPHREAAQKLPLAPVPAGLVATWRITGVLGAAVKPPLLSHQEEMPFLTRALPPLT